MFGLFKAGLVPVNTNYRYTDDELAYLWDNADAVARDLPRHVHRALRRDARPRAGRADVDLGRRRHRRVPRLGDRLRDAQRPSADRARSPPWGRSPDDLYILYTGGTTGMPKGVMWRQDDLVGSLDAPSRTRCRRCRDGTSSTPASSKPGPRNLPAAPLMHGTGAFNAMWNLVLAGSVVTMVGRHFDPVELLDTIADASRQQHLDRRRRVREADPARARRRARAVGHLVAAGDRVERRDVGRRDQGRPAAPQPAADHDRQPRQQRGDRHGIEHDDGRRSGRRLRADDRHSSASVRTRGCSPTTGARSQPGSGERGRVALRGRTPVGYYKDEAKSASTFITFEGVRWSIPGDFAEVEADGTLRLYGRGSQCINTGGEKVYPEEVEEALKLASVRRRRGRRRRARRALRRGDHRARRAARRRDHRRGGADRPRPHDTSPRSSRRSGSSSSTRSAAPPTASSTTSRSRPRHGVPRPELTTRCQDTPRLRSRNPTAPPASGLSDRQTPVHSARATQPSTWSLTTPIACMKA